MDGSCGVGWEGGFGKEKDDNVVDGVGVGEEEEGFGVGDDLEVGLDRSSAADTAKHEEILLSLFPFLFGLSGRFFVYCLICLPPVSLVGIFYSCVDCASIVRVYGKS